MRWRSPAEIAFRLRQESRNLILLGSPPRLPSGTKIHRLFPDPEAVAGALRGTARAGAIVAEAEEILAHRFHLFGLCLETGPEILWRRDPLSGAETQPLYFRRIPYLDASRAGDHKIIWELNRHQHLVVLAQAQRLTGRADFAAEIERQLDSWIEANPFQRGINWASALEVAFRALSWIWIEHLVGAQISPAARIRLLEGLYRHGHHLANNLSVYFSPNTHLLGEAVALHAIGKLFQGAPHAEDWIRAGRATVAAQLERQIHPDGSHFEQSSYYHVYAFDMFLFHAILDPPGETYRTTLGRMAEYLDALLGPARSLPAIGDDDGGRFFYPYGPRDRFGRATLATCGVFLGRPEWISDATDLHEQGAWWLGPEVLRAQGDPAPKGCGQSRWFPCAGSAVMVSGAIHAVVDAGPFGPFSSGHSHADTLSIIIRRGDEELLIDPGTFTYVGDPRLRDALRGTGAHNTIRIDRLDQADPAGPFAWRNPPSITLRRWESGPESDDLDAECFYRGFRHRRRIRFLKAGLFLIVDEIDGPPGEHEIEQFWHPGSVACRPHLVLEDPVEELASWRSKVFGECEPVPAFCVRRKTALPVRIGAAVLVDPATTVRIEHAGDVICFHWRQASPETVTIAI